jgi:hypothetical protein
VHRS